MLNKVLTLSQMVARLHDGMTVGIGGWGARRKPMALIREILRSALKDLSIVSYGGPDVGLLCAAGKVRKLIFGFVSLDLIPLEQHFRLARQAGAFQAWEIDEGMLHWGLRAAAMRLPFLPIRAGMGSDVVRLSEGLRTVRSPYQDGEELIAMPALELDVALLHVTEADQRGNTAILSPDPFFDDLFARAAQATYITCDRLRDTSEICSPERARYNTFERALVTGVAEVPYGAHPTASVPGYGIDVEHLNVYSASTAPGRWRQYCADFVDLPDHASYLAAVGGAERIRQIPAPVF
jgi:glutaconate CoA-transferase subunit A